MGSQRQEADHKMHVSGKTYAFKMSGDQSKEEKEKALDARIAAIRAKNEKQVQRQKEVEKDRRLAERQNQSVTTQPRLKEQEQEVEFVGEARGSRGKEYKKGRGGRDDDCQTLHQRLHAGVHPAG